MNPLQAFICIHIFKGMNPTRSKHPQREYACMYISYFYERGRGTHEGCVERGCLMRGLYPSYILHIFINKKKPTRGTGREKQHEAYTLYAINLCIYAEKN